MSFYAGFTRSLRIFMRKLRKFDRERIAEELGVSARSVFVSRVEAATLVFWDDVLVEFNWVGKGIVGHTIQLSRERKLSSHRPRKDAMRKYIASLVRIYTDATGKRMTRINQKYRVDKTLPDNRKVIAQRETKNPFLFTCMKVAGVVTYPRSIVREVLKQQ